MTATKCDMCREEIKGQPFQSELYPKPICEDCARAIHATTKQLAANGPRLGWGDMIRKEKNA